MSIFFNLDRQRRLVAEYSSTRAHIDEALPALSALAEEASTLLGIDMAEPRLADLQHLSSALHDDANDLAERAAFLEAADARTSYQLALRSGDLVNPNLAARALNSGWTYDEALLYQQLELLQNLPHPRTHEQQLEIASLVRQLSRTAHPSSVGRRTGDLDSDFTTPRVGEPYQSHADDPTERGRALILRALNDTTNPDQILTDEFEALLHDNGALTLILPGVADLSTPQLGNDPETNTLRDLDQHAIPSAFNSSLSANGYAKRIAEWTEHMVMTGVLEPGTPTMLIGHSFGGDTAFDLAADTHFNGELVNVTHIFSAGYYIDPAFEQLPDHTRAVATRNIYDAAAVTEFSAWGGHRRPAEQIAVDLAQKTANLERTLLDAALDAVGSSAAPIIPPAGFTAERSQQMAPNGTSITFSGSFDLDSFGHHPDDYSAFIENVKAPGVLDFFVELDTQGFTDNAVALSIDISDVAD